MEPKQYVKTKELVFFHKNVVSRTNKQTGSGDGAADWSDVEARYLNDNHRHAELRQKCISAAAQNKPIENEKKPSNAKSLPMNLYAVKKQQKRIAALLAADREASESHATNKQRRDLIKKRMNNIVQVSQYSKLSNEYKQKYDESVNYYLKDFYEKNEMALQQPSTFDELSMEDDRMHGDELNLLTPDSDHVLRSALPSMTISVNSHKSRNTRKQEQKTISEQVERMHQLRRASKAHSTHSEDMIFSMLSRANVKSQPPPKCVYMPDSRENTFYRALPTTEHAIPLTPDPIQSMTAPTTSADTQTNTYNEISNKELKENHLADVKVSTTEPSQNLSQRQAVQRTDTKVNEEKTDRDVSPEFRRIQVELRERKKAQSKSRDLMTKANDEPIRIPQKSTNRKDSLTMQTGRRGTRYTINAKSSFLSGSFSGPLPVIPSLDLSGTDISSKNLTEVFIGISRSSSVHDFNCSIRPFSETKQKNRPGSLFSYVDTKQRSKVRRAGKLQTPTMRHSVSISERSHSFEPALSQDGSCNCEEGMIKPRIYKSCTLCYNTFQHQPWCENRDEVKSLHCESCGGKIQGVLASSPLYDIDDVAISLPSLTSDDEDEDVIQIEDNKSVHSDGGEKGFMAAAEEEVTVPSSDEVLTNLPVIRLEDSDDWIERQMDRRTPSETSSRRMIASPDTMMNQLGSMLDSVAYDHSQLSVNDQATSERSMRMGNSAEDTQKTDRSSPVQENISSRTAPGSIIQSQDWTKVHQQAYNAALADARAKHLPVRPEYFGQRTTRSYTSTYFTKLPWGDDVVNTRKKTEVSRTKDKTPEMIKILGKTTVYDYYPGGKRNHLRNIQPIPKIKAGRL